jgi:hypothetical protein
VIHSHPAIPASIAASKLIISFSPHNHLNHEPKTTTPHRWRPSNQPTLPSDWYNRAVQLMANTPTDLTG